MANMKTPELHKVQMAKTKQVKKQTDELRADKERVKTVYSIADNHKEQWRRKQKHWRRTNEVVIKKQGQMIKLMSKKNCENKYKKTCETKYEDTQKRINTMLGMPPKPDSGLSFEYLG